MANVTWSTSRRTGERVARLRWREGGVQRSRVLGPVTREQARLAASAQTVIEARETRASASGLKRFPLCSDAPPNIRALLPAVFAFDPNEYPPAVYMLVVSGEVVYVGQAMRLHRRIHQHMARIAFDRVLWLPVAADRLDDVEQALIFLLRPRLNKACHYLGDRESALDAVNLAAVDSIVEDCARHAARAAEPRAIGSRAPEQAPPSDADLVAGMEAFRAHMQAQA